MELDKAIEGIRKYRELIHAQDMWESPMDLSDTMTKLSVYNAYLADNIAPLHKQATDKAYMVFTEAKSKDLPVTQAEAMSRGESTQERATYENVKNVYQATSNLISVLQSRLRVIENQIKQEGKND